MSRPLFFTLASWLLAATAATAAPRDDVLRLVPADAAVVLVVQNARAHVQELTQSPFAQWFPSTAIGQRLTGSPELKQLRESGGLILGQLGTTPAALLDEIFGDAVAFAYSPASASGDERSLLVIRPAKPESLTRLIERMTDLQRRAGEIKDVSPREYAGITYYQRLKPGGADYYCMHDGVFVFSASEKELRAALDRAKAMADRPPELLARMKRLGVAEAVGMVLINPRALDAEVKAKVASAKAEDRRFLGRFAEAWSALDQAAVYLIIDRDLELGVSLRFQPEKLPPDLRKWLTGPRAAAAEIIPQQALFGFSGSVRAVELLDLVASIAPTEPGKPDVKKWVNETLGPVMGRDKLPQVLDSLGPNWAVWAEPPTGADPLPSFVAAVEVKAESAARGTTEKALREAVEFGFKTARVAYNSSHADQIEVTEEKDPVSGAVVTMLTNEKGFPPGLRPCFAVVDGYLVVASSPGPIKRFKAPRTPPAEKGSLTVARLSGKQSRAYLLSHSEHLADFLAGVGVGQKKSLVEQLKGLAEVLELIDSAEIVVRGDPAGVTLAAHVKFAQPLK